MINRRTLIYVVVGVLLLAFVIFGFSDKNIPYKKTLSKDTENLIKEIKQIEIELVDINEMPAGTSYVVRLKNNSPYLIKYNVLFVSIPIKTANGYSENNFKIQATPNKLDILPNEEITLNAFAPIEVYKDNDLLDNMEPSYKFVAYLNEINEETRITKGGSLKP